MWRQTLCCFAAALPGSVAFVAIPAAARGPQELPPPTCAQLTLSPAYGIVGAPNVKSASSSVVAAQGSNVSYCRVQILYGKGADQNINIAVGLPLSPLDGGKGGVVGAWNGRTQGLGGGGCSGTLVVNSAVNTGYVGSGTDLGHTGGDCEPGVNDDGTYNMQFIQDFIRNAIKQQVLWSKAVTRTYYGEPAAFNYWNGCSTGGRQGYLLAQELGDELQGIVANAPAIYWTRFQTAQMWGQIAMKDLARGAIDPAKLAQARASATAACDGNDGVVDGIINDPKSCRFSAKANICGTSSAPAANCLTAQEADAIDRIWDGPRNDEHERVWFGLDQGSDFSILNGPAPFALGVTQIHWDLHDRNFDWRTIPLSDYADVAQQGSRNIADVTDTFGDLDKFKRSGGKMITWVGANDQFIYPRGVLKYYREMAARYDRHGRDDAHPDFGSIYGFYRLFYAPGVGHCGIGSTGPVPNDAFGALVNWVEKGVAPDALLASGGSAAPSTGRTRPVCLYPKTAIYNGSGSIDDANNWHCGGNLETKANVCRDILVKYKHEARGKLDFSDSGVDAQDCFALEHRRDEPGRH